MNMHMRARVTLLLAGCALAVPSANAMIVSDGQTYVSPTVGDDHARIASVTPASTPTTVVRGDDHARTTAVTAIGTTGTFTSGTGLARTTPVTPVASLPVSAEPGGFDWDDAGIGFGIAAGLALLAGGTLLSSRRMRPPHTPAI